MSPVMQSTPLPRPALWLGLAGLTPFFAATALALGVPDWRPVALPALAAYGAVILSFLGAVHWGFALRAAGAEARATPARLGLGVMPSLLAWVALLLPLPFALPLLALGLLATAGVESLAARQGLMPDGYLRLRLGLSFTAGLCLLTGAGLAR